MAANGVRIRNTKEHKNPDSVYLGNDGKYYNSRKYTMQNFCSELIRVFFQNEKIEQCTFAINRVANKYHNDSIVEMISTLHKNEGCKNFLSIFTKQIIYVKCYMDKYSGKVNTRASPCCASAGILFFY